MTARPTFQKYEAAGYASELLPVAPPGSKVSPNSNLDPNDLGKVPSRLTSAGWVGCKDWTQQTYGPEETAKFQESGAGIGIQARAFPAVDIDVTRAEVSEAVHKLAVNMLGQSPRRVGRAPKCLLPYRGDVGSRSLQFALPEDEKPHLVEILGRRKHWVAEGIHPKTGQPYEWPDGRKPAGSLPEIDEAKLDAFFEALELLLASMGATDFKVSGGGRQSTAAPPTEALLAPSIDDVREALRLIPNHADEALGYEDWVAILACVKGATGGSGEGQALFDEWSSGELTGGANAKHNPDTTATKWASMPPRTGWAQLRSRVQKTGPDGAARAADWAAAAAASEFPAIEPAPEPKAALRRIGMPPSITAAELQVTEFAPVSWVVNRFLPQGLSMLAGKPKLGKSWLMLDVAVAVSTGGTVLGERCDPGDVLYAALEDNQRRLKERMAKVFPLPTWPARLTFWTEMNRLEAGGLDQLQAWVHSVERPRLIVIDVFSKVRRAKGGNEGLYDADYLAVSPLKKFVEETGVAVVIVHHLRKMAAESDPLDMVSGSTGLTGAMDTILVLNRGTAGVTLYVRGRDVGEVESAVEFDKVACRWSVLGNASDVHISEERRAILDVLRADGRGLGPKDIARILGRPEDPVRMLLWKMVHQGEVAKSQRGKYHLPDITPGNIGNKVTLEAVDRLFEAPGSANVSVVTGVIGVTGPEAAQ